MIMFLASGIMVTLLVMYAQSGKTTIFIEDIIKLSEEDDEEIFIIINPNNQIVTQQTSIRATKAKIKAVEIISSVKKEDKYAIKSLNFPINIDGHTEPVRFHKALREKLVNTFSVCDNNRRWEDVKEIIEEANYMNRNVTLIIDEADQVLADSKIDKLAEITNKYTNSRIQIKLITATPFTWNNSMKKFDWVGKKLKYGGVLNLFPLKHIHGEKYHKLNDSKFTIMEGKEDCVEYTYKHLCENNPKKGDYIMFPAGTKRESHNDMIDKVSKFFDFIILLNGTDKVIIQFDKDGKEIRRHPIPRYKEIKEVLEGFSERYKWFDKEEGKRIGITGKICLGRGVTFSINGKLITKIIYNKFSELNDIIQLLCRVCGYKSESENPPEVVTTSKIKEHIEIYDEMMEDILSRALEIKDPNINTEYLNSLFSHCKKRLANKKKPIKVVKYETLDQVWSYLECPEILKKIGQIRISREDGINKIDGYYISTKLNYGSKRRKADLTADDRIFENQLDKIADGQCIGDLDENGKKTNGPCYLIVPYYKDKESQPDEVMFQLRHLNRKLK